MENINSVARISKKEIENFIEGRDPFERIVYIDYKYTDKFVTVYYRNEQDQKCQRKFPFKPFCWATRTACLNLCHGDRHELINLMAKYGIGVKKLNTTAINGEDRSELFEDGYLFMFYAKASMSYTNFLGFFKACDNPVYGKRDSNGNQVPMSKSEERQFLIVTPQEQFMIQTGKRYFKGYNDYDEIYRMIFDLETEGLDPHRHRIAQIGIRTNRGFERILTITGNTKEERDANELKAIETFVKAINYFKPDIITAHNGENFDWNFLITRCEMLGTSMEEVSSKYFGGDYIKKENRESNLKLGGEIETFFRTIVPNTIVTDSLHAVRRAQALDSNMLKADLKYATKYAKMVKPNRVYVPGDIINTTWADTVNDYAFDNSNGNWYKITDTNPIKEGYEIVTGKYIVERYLMDDLWECDKVEWKYNSTNFLICKILPVPFSKCVTMGTAGQWKAIMLAWSYENNLAVPMGENTGSFTGGLSRLLSTGYVDNVVKLDYNSLYPSIILTWGISDNNDLMDSMLSMLEYVLTTREKYKGVKKAAGKTVDKLKGKIIDKTATEEETAEYNKASAEYALADGKQMQMKCLGNSFFGSYGSNNGSVFPWKSQKCAEQTTCTGRQSLRLMISHFSSLGYKPIVGDTDGFNFKLPDESTYRYTDEHPYIGKGSNREVKLGVKYTGFEADVAEFNDLYMKDVHSPKGVQKMGLGIDEVVSSTINFSRKNYADHFPDNPYPNDVKLVGNSIKSKKMPTYIAKFLDVAVRQLLRGDGQGFLEEYYKTIDKIYNYRVPLKDIATKGKIKKSLEQYKKDVMEITKAGRPKSRQAWYELAIKEDMHVDNGDTIYYINTGKSKSHADVKKITHYIENGFDVTKDIEKELKAYKKSCKDNGVKELSKNAWMQKYHPNMHIEDEIVMNCVLVPREIMESEKDILCSEFKGADGFMIEYNCPKYIDAFNNRIKPLLVCFDKSIRDRILITNPDDRNFFTEDECKLISGVPNKPSDQDTYEQLMTMDDKEIKFWTKYNMIPPFIEECGMGKWEDIVKDYNDRQEKEKQLGIDKDKEEYYNIINNMSVEEINSFFDDGNLPKELYSIVDLNPTTNEFVSKKYPDVSFGTLNDLMDAYYSIKSISEA